MSNTGHAPSGPTALATLIAQSSLGRYPPGHRPTHRPPSATVHGPEFTTKKAGMNAGGPSIGTSPSAAAVTVPVSEPHSENSGTDTTSSTRRLPAPERPVCAVARAKAGMASRASESEPPPVTAIAAPCSGAQSASDGLAAGGSRSAEQGSNGGQTSGR